MIIRVLKSRQASAHIGVDSIHTHAVAWAGCRHTVINVNLTGRSSVANCTLTGEIKCSHWCTAAVISTGTWITCQNSCSHHAVNMQVCLLNKEPKLTFCAIVSGVPEPFPTLNWTITVACVVSIHPIILGSAKSSTVWSIVILLTHHSKSHIQDNSVPGTGSTVPLYWSEAGIHL